MGCPISLFLPPPPPPLPHAAAGLGRSETRPRTPTSTCFGRRSTAAAPPFSSCTYRTNHVTQRRQSRDRRLGRSYGHLVAVLGFAKRQARHDTPRQDANLGSHAVAVHNTATYLADYNFTWPRSQVVMGVYCFSLLCR